VVTKVERKTSEQLSVAIIKRLMPIASRVKTVTLDNGKEFAGRKQNDESLGSTVYLVDPFARWLRESNENFNGLLPYYIEKKRPSSTTTVMEFKMNESRF
jgi:IS30 family transposase